MANNRAFLVGLKCRKQVFSRYGSTIRNHRTAGIMDKLHHEKTCPKGFRPCLTQTGLYSHRWLEARKGPFRFRKQRNCTIYVAKTKALISCACSSPLFSHRQNTGFLMTRPMGKLPIRISNTYLRDISV